MKTWLSWLLVVLLSLVFVPRAGAQEDEDEGWETGSEEGAGEEEGGEEDPWEAPATGETEGTEESDVTAGEPEVVIPTGYPVAEIDRPLTLPRMTLEPRLDFTIDIIDEGDNWVSTRLAAGFGVIDNLEAGLEFPLNFSPKFKASDFRLYGMYEFGPFMDGKLFTAAKLQMIIPFSDKSFPYGYVDFGMLLEGIAKYKLHDMFALVADLGLGFVSTEFDKTWFLFQLDAGALVQPIEPLALSLTFGVMALAGDNVPDDYEIGIPMKFRGQYTIVGDLDVFMEVGFMDLEEGTDWVQLLFGAAYRVGL